MTKPKPKHTPAGPPPATPLEAHLIALLMESREQYRDLLGKYHALVETLTGEKGPAPLKPAKVRGGPSDEELVTKREQDAAHAIIKRKLAQREKDDAAFVKKASDEFIAQGLSPTDAAAEARRLRDISRGTTEEVDQ